MSTPRSPSRRAALALLGAAAGCTHIGLGERGAGGPPLIDALGGIDDPNAALKEPPQSAFAPRELKFSERGFADARAAGLSAFNLTLGYVAGSEEPFEQSVREIAAWDEMIRAHPGQLLKVLRADDIEAAKRAGRIGVIYGFQNAAQLGADAARADTFQRLGVRIVQLTYNNKNALGCGAVVPEDTGLTEFGRACVARLNDRRVLVDLSHGGPRTIADAIEASHMPVAITHTGCRALADLPRNVRDETLRRLAEKGGVAGIYFMPFLAVGRQPGAADVVRHIEHAWDAMGEDHVGIGTDNSVSGIDDLGAYRERLKREIEERRKLGVSAPGETPDIVPFVPELMGPDKFAKLRGLLAARGHKAARLDKLFGLNFLRLFREVWG